MSPKVLEVVESPMEPTTESRSTKAPAVKTAHPAVKTTTHSAVETASAPHPATSALGNYGQCQQATNEKQLKNFSHRQTSKRDQNAGRFLWPTCPQPGNLRTALCPASRHSC